MTLNLRFLIMPKFIFRSWCIFFSLFVLIGIVGCAGTPDRFYIPKAQPISAKQALNPEFNTHRYVNLVNQAVDKDVFIGAYTHDWWANYHRWTDAAVEILQTELKNRSKIVNVNATTVFALGICTHSNGNITGTLYTDLQKTGCPLDTDQDGILDANDKCPETPKGISVDYCGCPSDTDGDGVPDYKDQCAGKPKEKKDINPNKKKEEQRPGGAKANSDWWRFPENVPDCKTTYFSIAGQEPPDAVVQLIKTELEKESIVFTENNANVFTFSTNAEEWKEAHWKLEEALENRDMLMIEGPPQILQLAITHVNLFWNFHDVGCTLNLQARTLQEQARNFKSTNISPELYVSCNWALAKAVAQMFVDPATLRDSDGDGVPDHLDECPGTPKGVKVDEVGCPLDTDGDGVPDYLDECPGTPKGLKVDERGCPPDTDGDGVPDYLDECPGTPKGVKVDEVGCPLDTDGDGVPDYLDECPGTPKGAKVDERGCWVISEALFDFNKYEIRTGFYPHLDEIVTVLKENPNMVIEIQGHTDNVGSSQYNKKLSENRAKAVKNYLIKKGISNQRLIAVGFGKSRPKTTNRTEEGRALNRRVELLPVQ
jgi:hypothetical protein